MLAKDRTQSYSECFEDVTGMGLDAVWARPPLAFLLVQDANYCVIVQQPDLQLEP